MKKINKEPTLEIKPTPELAKYYRIRRIDVRSYDLLELQPDLTEKILATDVLPIIRNKFLLLAIDNTYPDKG